MIYTIISVYFNFLLFCSVFNYWRLVELVNDKELTFIEKVLSYLIALPAYVIFTKLYKLGSLFFKIDD